MKNRVVGLLVLASLVGGTAGISRAENEWNQGRREERREERREQFQKKHPRRAEVNRRIHRQRRRIRQEVREGDITKTQAKADNRALNGIKVQERRDVGQNGGTLTKQQQGQLNQELNGNSQNIGK
jgi:hypothetical protein